jgi:hypothetical protein
MFQFSTKASGTRKQTCHTVKVSRSGSMEESTPGSFTKANAKAKGDTSTLTVTTRKESLMTESRKAMESSIIQTAMYLLVSSTTAGLKKVTECSSTMTNMKVSSYLTGCMA